MQIVHTFKGIVESSVIISLDSCAHHCVIRPIFLSFFLFLLGNEKQKSTMFMPDFFHTMSMSYKVIGCQVTNLPISYLWLMVS